MSKYEPVIIDIETTGLDPLAQEGFMGARMDARVTAVGLTFIPGWREANSIDELEMDAYSITDKSEYKLLQRVPSRLQAYVEEYYGEDCEPFFVGHNVRQFDFPYLGARFARLRLDGEPFISEYKRLDTMRVAGNDGTIEGWYISEDDYAEHLGIEVNDEYDGSDMPDAYQNGEWDKINSHVVSDIQVNAQIFFQRRQLCMDQLSEHYDDVDIDPVFVEEVDSL